MAQPTTGAIGPGASAVLPLPSGVTTWTNFTASWTCSSPSDVNAGAWLQGSADGGVTWFPLRVDDSVASGQTGTGALFYRFKPVTALQAFVTCSSGNTVTVTVAGE